MADADLAAKVKECLAWGAPGLEATRLTQAINAARYDSNLLALSRCLTFGEPSSAAR